MASQCKQCGRRDLEVAPGVVPVINGSNWTGEQFFKIEETNDQMCVTQDAHDFLEQQQFSNLELKYAGYIDPSKLKFVAERPQHRETPMAAASSTTYSSSDIELMDTERR